MMLMVFHVNMITIAIDLKQIWKNISSSWIWVDISWNILHFEATDRLWAKGRETKHSHSCHTRRIFAWIQDVERIDSDAVVFSDPLPGRDNNEANRSILRLRRPLIFIYREKVRRVG